MCSGDGDLELKVQDGAMNILFQFVCLLKKDESGVYGLFGGIASICVRWASLERLNSLRRSSSHLTCIICSARPCRDWREVITTYNNAKGVDTRMGEGTGLGKYLSGLVPWMWLVVVNIVTDYNNRQNDPCDEEADPSQLAAALTELRGTVPYRASLTANTQATLKLIINRFVTVTTLYGKQ